MNEKSKIGLIRAERRTRSEPKSENPSRMNHPSLLIEASGEAKPPPASDVGKHAQVELVIEGQRIHVDLEDLAEIDDAGAYLWWADLLSRAEREHEMLKATLKHSEGIARAHAKKGSTTLPHALPDWLARQHLIADTGRNVTLLREIVALLRARQGPLGPIG